MTKRQADIIKLEALCELVGTEHLQKTLVTLLERMIYGRSRIEQLLDGRAPLDEGFIFIFAHQLTSAAKLLGFTELQQSAASISDEFSAEALDYREVRAFCELVKNCEKSLSQAIEDMKQAI